MRASPLSVAGLLVAVGCSSVSNSTRAPSLDGTAWVLASLQGLTLLPGQPPTIAFQGGRAVGSDGCNRFTTTYTAKESALTIDKGATTMMACPHERMQQADAFMAALSAARTYRIANGRLELLFPEGTVLATFSKQSTELAGTSWRATGINNGKGAVASTVSGSTVTLRFGTDGTASGSAGCNNFTVPYAAKDGSLRFTGPTALTRKMCPQEGVMEQEQAFLAALESVATARVEGDRLELRTADGAMAASLVTNPGR
jgi:heat shock protein HslJ